MTYRLSHLDALASEAIHIIREVVAEFERPALLFSGGKDSAVLLHLAAKACWPQRVPFPVVHVDTGHNFPEVIEYRDQQVAELDVRLVVGSVQEDIDRGSIVEQPVPGATRNRLQTFTLLEGARGGPLRRRLRRGPARRGEGAGPRSGSSRCGTSSASGTPARSGPSCGTCTTRGTARASTSGSSRSRTGPSSTSGSTSRSRSSTSPRSTSPTAATVFRRAGHAARGRAWTSPREGVRRGAPSRRPCATAPSAT